MFGTKIICPKCEAEFKNKDARFCPQCGAPVPGSHTDIVVIVDRSGSMQSCHEATVTGFNRFLADQKALPGVASLTLAQFDNEYELLIHRKPIGEVGAVDKASFVPRGSTALFDAIGRTLATMEAATDSCIVCIITDGQENSSRESTKQQIRDMIRRLEAKGWSFIYLGANQDAFSEGVSLGIQNAATYKGNPLGTGAVYACASNNVGSYRRFGQSAQQAGFAASVAFLNS